MLVLRHEQLDRAHSGLGRASMGPGKETPGWPAGGVDTIWLLLGRSSLVGLVKRTMRRPQIWMPAATNAIERLPVPAAQAPLGCDVLLLGDGASTTGCSTRTPATISLCVGVCVFQRDGVVVSLRPSLPASAVARPDDRRLLVQVDRHGQDHDQSPRPSLPSGSCQLPETDSVFVGDPGWPFWGRRALALGARRERKTKRPFAACSYPRRSRPHDCDRTAVRGLGVDDISFTVHPRDAKLNPVLP